MTAIISPTKRFPASICTAPDQTRAICVKLIIRVRAGIIKAMVRCILMVTAVRLRLASSKRFSS